MRPILAATRFISLIGSCHVLDSLCAKYCRLLASSLSRSLIARAGDQPDDNPDQQSRAKRDAIDSAGRWRIISWASSYRSIVRLADLFGGAAQRFRCLIGILASRFGDMGKRTAGLFVQIAQNALDLLPAFARLLLHQADQLIEVAFDFLQLIVGELPPPLFDLCPSTDSSFP